MPSWPASRTRPAPPLPQCQWLVGTRLRRCDPISLPVPIAPGYSLLAHWLDYCCCCWQNPCDLLRDEGINCMSALNVHGQGGVAVSDDDLKAKCQEKFEAYRMCMRAWQDAKIAEREAERAAARR